MLSKGLRRKWKLAERDGLMGCVYCGRCIPPHRLVLDHVVPRSRGGSDGNANRVLACKACDWAKADRTPQEWIPGLWWDLPALDTPPDHVVRAHP